MQSLCIATAKQYRPMVYWSIGGQTCLRAEQVRPPTKAVILRHSLIICRHSCLFLSDFRHSFFADHCSHFAGGGEGVIVVWNLPVTSSWHQMAFQCRSRAIYRLARNNSYATFVSRISSLSHQLKHSCPDSSAFRALMLNHNVHIIFNWWLAACDCI